MNGAGARLGLAGVLWLTSCAPSEPFPGGRTLDLECIRQERAPTAAEITGLVDALVQTYLAGRDPASLDLLLEFDAYDRRNDSSMTNRSHAVALLASGGRFRFQSVKRGVSAILLSDGEEAWSILDNTQPGRAIGDPAKPILWFEMALYPLRYLRGPGVVLEGLPPRTEDGRTLVPVVCRRTYEPVVTYLIDPEGPLIHAVEAVLPVTVLTRQAQVSEQVRFEYEDHRRESGVLVPFTLRAFSEGAVAEVLDLIRLEVDPPTEGVVFRAD